MADAPSGAELERLVATRRDLHRHPELGYQEHRTAGLVAERLRAAGYAVRTGVAETGVVGTLAGAGGEGPCLLIRADMDALPIQEESTRDYASTVPGRMHACGHDGHVAIALAVAERLAARRDWPGSIRFVFQPAEEGGGGALRMIGEGVLEGVDAALGLHLWLSLQSGVVAAVDGAQMAGSQDFRIVVRGRGGHGAIPQETIDAAVVAAHLVVGLQTVVSRAMDPLDPAVVTVGSIRAGSAPNVIADSAVLEGTLRFFSTDTAVRIRERIAAVVAGICAAFGAEHEIDFGDRPYPPTVNAPRMAGLVRRAAMEMLGAERVRDDAGVRTMAAEDFSEFASRVPACFLFVGARDPATGAVHPHHSPRFDVCERALPLGVAVLERAARLFLAGGG